MLFSSLYPISISSDLYNLRNQEGPLPTPLDAEVLPHPLLWGNAESTFINFRIYTIMWSFLTLSAIQHTLTITQMTSWHQSKIRKTIFELSPYSSDDLYHNSWIIGLIYHFHAHSSRGITKPASASISVYFTSKYHYFFSGWQISDQILSIIKIQCEGKGYLHTKTHVVKSEKLTLYLKIIHS